MKSKGHSGSEVVGSLYLAGASLFFSVSLVAIIALARAEMAPDIGQDPPYSLETTLIVTLIMGIMCLGAWASKRSQIKSAENLERIANATEAIADRVETPRAPPPPSN